jgi:hypothetical protein
VSKEKRLMFVRVLNLLLIAGLVVVGLRARSLEVLAAGGDYLPDAAAIAVSLFAIRQRVFQDLAVREGLGCSGRIAGGRGRVGGRCRFVNSGGAPQPPLGIWIQTAVPVMAVPDLASVYVTSVPLQKWKVRVTVELSVTPSKNAAGRVIFPAV